MLDFKAVKQKEISFAELVSDLSPDDLRDLTHEMVDKMQDLIRDCVDKDVVFEPKDPDAYDSYAEDADDVLTLREIRQPVDIAACGVEVQVAPRLGQLAADQVERPVFRLEHELLGHLAQQPEAGLERMPGHVAGPHRRGEQPRGGFRRQVARVGVQRPHPPHLETQNPTPGSHHQVPGARDPFRGHLLPGQHRSACRG